MIPTERNQGAAAVAAQRPNPEFRVHSHAPPA
jgi:hypothetical protein